jgi:hypothetical protein
MAAEVPEVVPGVGAAQTAVLEVVEEWAEETVAVEAEAVVVDRPGPLGKQAESLVSKAGTESE